MTDKEWDAFGYDSMVACAVCGGLPTKSEPRFGYSICREHADTDPVSVGSVALKNTKQQPAYLADKIDVA